MIGTTITNGRADLGGTILVMSGTLTLLCTTVSSSTATASGGGINVGNRATATLYSSTVSGNSVRPHNAGESVVKNGVQEGLGRAVVLRRNGQRVQ